MFALLRHYGAPSRFIDVTGSLAVALYNACLSSGNAPESDARVFAFHCGTTDFSEHISDLGLGPATDLEVGPLNTAPSWWEAPPEWWSGSRTVWRAPAFDDRIVRQYGGFLIGGVPEICHNGESHAHRVHEASGSPALHATNVADGEDLASVNIRSCGAAEGGTPPTQPVRNFRISGKAKTDMLRDLRMLFGVSAAGVYPDAAGFVELGVASLFGDS